MHSFLLQIYCRLLQPTVSSSLHFEPKKCSFYRILLTDFWSMLQPKGVQKSFCRLSTHLCSQREPSGTVQSEHPVARSNCPTAESKLFPSPPHPRPLVGNHHQPADNPLLHSLQAFERPSVLQQSRFALTRSTCSGFYQNVCNPVRPQRVPEGTRLLEFQMNTRNLLEKFYYSTE